MSSRSIVEKIALGLIALILTGGLWRLFSGGSESSVDGDLRTQVILAAIYFVVAAIALGNGRKTASVIRRAPALFALLLLACVSPLWAEIPDLVFRRALGLAGTSLFGVVLATRFSLEEQLNLLRWVFRWVAVLCVALLGVAPHYAISSGAEGGALRGIFTHKNLLGAAMALAILVEWHLAGGKGWSRVMKGLFLCAYLALLVLSNSMTSIVTIFLTLVVMWIFRVLYRKYRVPLVAVVLFVMVTVSAFTVAGVDAQMLTGMVGRSSDLTGRTELWDAVISMIHKHPVLGFGFSGFWKDASSESAVVETHILWTPTYSHNGYLEITLSLGLLGMFLFLVAFVTGARHAWWHARNGKTVLDLWPLAFLIFFAIHNMAECTIAWQNCLEWSVFVATVLGSREKLYTLFTEEDSADEALNISATECA
jgi:exopolysaccharide production protein ExoQ